ncbi:nucleocapsid protein [Lakamha virus]|uniref:Nucleocapsid protein n=1 Tax=Lakamha virus TaxID=2609059 RepID=A0A5C2D2J2_9VIRU|nr:nucleocapsid protein [Lakamha virus]QEO75953.1 nucleocapsid protein [Lakamha virus]
MYQFNFDEPISTSNFKGKEFYEAHQNDSFLVDETNVAKILAQGKKMKESLQTYQSIKLPFFISDNEPLIVLKGTSDLDANDYTVNRLTGLCARYAAERYNSVPISALAESIGIPRPTNKSNMNLVKQYLSATPGSEHHMDFFGHWPLIVQLYLYNNNKLTTESMKRIMGIKNDSGQKYSTLFLNDSNVPNMIRETKKWTGASSAYKLDLEKTMQKFVSLYNSQ